MPMFVRDSPEVWYPLASLPGYELSSHYRLLSPYCGSRGEKFNGRTILKLAVNHNGYPFFQAYLAGKRISALLHVLVAEIAFGPKPTGLNVLHKDDDKQNYEPSNLYYGNQKDNARDATRNGKYNRARGEANNAKLTEDQVREMRSLRERGAIFREIASRYNIDCSTAVRIIQRKKWSHVS